VAPGQGCGSRSALCAKATGLAPGFRLGRRRPTTLGVPRNPDPADPRTFSIDNNPRELISVGPAIASGLPVDHSGENIRMHPRCCRGAGRAQEGFAPQRRHFGEVTSRTRHPRRYARKATHSPGRSRQSSSVPRRSGEDRRTLSRPGMTPLDAHRGEPEGGDQTGDTHGAPWLPCWRGIHSLSSREGWRPARGTAAESRKVSRGRWARVVSTARKYRNRYGSGGTRVHAPGR
jgi:hypothetical protein